MKKIKQFLSLVLAAGMVFGLTACGNPEGTGSQTTTTPSKNDSQTETTAPAENNAPKEIVKPDTISVVWDGTIFKEGDNYAEAFYQALNDKLGIDVKFTRPDHSKYAEQVGTIMTDEENIPDVIILPSNLYAAYASQGLLWDMTDAWKNSETANSGRLEAVADQVINTWYVPGEDGNKAIYGFYPARGNGCVTYVKSTDAMAAGYTEDTLPKTWAEFQQFLLALKDATGVAPVLAAGGFVNNEAPYVNYLPEFWQNGYPDFMKDANGQWIDGFKTAETRAALERLKWGWDNGVIDVDILTNPGTSYVREKFYLPETEKDDKTVGTPSIFTYWAGTWAYTIKSKLASKYVETEKYTKDQYQTAWVLTPIAEMGAYMERQSPMICITSACKNPEGVFKYFIDTMLDGGDTQMLWMYGVEGTHYVWNEDHTKIDGLATEATAGTEKESKTSKNLFEANLKLGNFTTTDPYTPADACIDECFNLFNANSVGAPELTSSEVYAQYGADLFTFRKQMITAAVTGVYDEKPVTIDDCYRMYDEKTAEIVEAILESYNN